MEVDATDPIVVVLTWVLTYLAGLLGERVDDRLRHLLPLVALVIAVAARAVLETLQGEAVTGETVLRALAAAGTAVLAHSQVREALKAAGQTDGD